MVFLTKHSSQLQKEHFQVSARTAAERAFETQTEEFLSMHILVKPKSKVHHFKSDLPIVQSVLKIL